MTITLDLSQAFGTIVALVFGAVVIGIIVMLYKRIVGFFRGRRFDPSNRERMRRRWSEIEGMLKTQGEMGRKLAVLEADKLLDQALKGLSMPGETLGERLKFAQYKFPALRDVWWAHKVRNQLAHESSYHLDAGVARRAIAAFAKALRLLGAI